MANVSGKINPSGVELKDTDILRADSSDNLEVGFTTDVETLSSAASIAPDLTGPYMKLMVVNQNITINEPADGVYGDCVIALNIDSGGPYTVTLGAGVAAVGVIPDLVASSWYECIVRKWSDALTTVAIQQAVS